MENSQINTNYIYVYRYDCTNEILDTANHLQLIQYLTNKFKLDNIGVAYHQYKNSEENPRDLMTKNMSILLQCKGVYFPKGSFNNDNTDARIIYDIATQLDLPIYEEEYRRLYKFKWDCEDDGKIEGFFLSTDEDILNLLGNDMVFDNILGKYSHIDGIFEIEDVEFVTDKPYDIEQILKLDVGYNPINYILSTTRIRDNEIRLRNTKKGGINYD